MVWAKIKRKTARRNLKVNLNEVERITESEVHGITAKQFSKFGAPAIKEEYKYRKMSRVKDEYVTN